MQCFTQHKVRDCTMSEEVLPVVESGQLAASVLVVTWNRPESLRRCLLSLAGQTRCWEQCEILIFDVSDQDVESIAASFSERLPINYHRGRNEGVCGNRNAAAHFARGVVLLFIDDDCIVSPAWLNSLLSACIQHPNVLVAARVEGLCYENVFVEAGQTITVLVDQYFNPRNAPPRFVPGVNFGLHRAQFLALGGFDLSFRGVGSEDRDFVHRWLVSGGHIEIVECATVRHDHRATFTGFVRQYVSYGRGAWRFHRKWRHTKHRPSTLRDLGLHYYVLLRMPLLLAELSPRRRVQIPVLLAIWQIANLVGFIRESASEAVRHLRRGAPL